MLYFVIMYMKNIFMYNNGMCRAAPTEQEVFFLFMYTNIVFSSKFLNPLLYTKINQYVKLFYHSIPNFGKEYL